MKYTFPFALAAALIFGCSSSNKNTRTAGNDTGTSQQGSIEGTQGTAGGANGTQATASAGTSNPNGGATASNSTGTDTNPQGSASGSATGTATSPGATSGSTSSTYGQNGTSGTSGTSGDTSAGSTGSSGSTYGQSGTAGTAGSSGSSGSTYGQNSGSTGSADQSGSTNSGSTPGSMASNGGSTSDNASLRTVTGAVEKVDQNSITLDQAAGGVTLTVDSQTQVLRRGQPVAAGISAIHEGQKVRASFDPASNRADKIEVMGMKHHKHMKMKSGSSMQQPSDNSNQNGK